MVKNPPANAGDIRDVRLIPGSGRSPRVGNGTPLQHSFFFVLFFSFLGALYFITSLNYNSFFNFYLLLLIFLISAFQYAI